MMIFRLWLWKRNLINLKKTVWTLVPRPYGQPIIGTKYLEINLMKMV